MGNDQIYALLIDMQGEITALKGMMETHLEAHRANDEKDSKKGDRSWSFWEKVIMVFVSTGVGFLSAKLGLK